MEDHRAVRTSVHALLELIHTLHSRCKRVHAVNISDLGVLSLWMFMKMMLVGAALVFAGTFSNLAVADDIQAELHPVSVVSIDSGDPDVVVFVVKFDLSLTNGSAKPMDLPKPGPESDLTRMAVLGVQSKGPDGSWANVIQSSFYDLGTSKYESCISLPPLVGAPRG